VNEIFAGIWRGRAAEVWFEVEIEKTAGVRLEGKLFYLAFVNGTLVVVLPVLVFITKVDGCLLRTFTCEFFFFFFFFFNFSTFVGSFIN
jgi:hypothetical protein